MDTSDTRHWKLNLAMLWFSQVTVLTGFAAVMPFIPLFFKECIGITDEGECGLYVSYFNVAGTLAYTLFIPIWGKLSDKYGVKIMLLRGTFGTGFIFPIMGFTTNAWLLIFLRFLTAACAGTTAASQTLIVKNTPEDKIGFALGVFSTAYWSGAMLGYVAGGLLVDLAGYQSTFIFCGILYFIGGITVLFVHEDCKPAPEIKKHKNSPGSWLVNLNFADWMPKLTTVVWIMLSLFLLTGFVRSFEIAYPAMLIEKITGPERAAYWTGIVSAFAAVGAMASGAIFGYLADRIDPVKLLLPALLITGITLIIQAAADSVFTFGWGRTLMCLGGGGLAPIFQKALANVTPKQKRGAVFGLSSTFNGIGNILAAFAAGGVIYLWGTRGVFYAAALFAFLMIPAASFMLKAVIKSRFYRKNIQKNS